jgi:hypothetical protein
VLFVSLSLVAAAVLSLGVSGAACFHYMLVSIFQLTASTRFTSIKNQMRTAAAALCSHHYCYYRRSAPSASFTPLLFITLSASSLADRYSPQSSKPLYCIILLNNCFKLQD